MLQKNYAETAVKLMIFMNPPPQGLISSYSDSLEWVILILYILI